MTRTGAVKSAVRVMRVLEYFDGVRRAAGVTDIALALGFPPSSTAALLQSLVGMGYLTQDEQRNYQPTPRVTLLGAWIEPALTPDGAVLSAMDALSRETGETIILGVRSGQLVRYLHVVQARTPMRVHVDAGETRPLALSGIGRALMSQLDDGEIRDIVTRHNVQCDDPGRCVISAALRRDIRQIRAQGYAVSIDRFIQGAGLVAVALPDGTGKTPMALAIAGLSSSIRADAKRLADRIRDQADRHRR